MGKATEGYGGPIPYTLSCGVTGTLFIPYGSPLDYANCLQKMDAEQCPEEEDDTTQPADVEQE